MHGGKILEQVEIDLLGENILTVYINVYDNSLSQKWLRALDQLLVGNYHLEKNFCFHGFVHHERDGNFLLHELNQSIKAINTADIGYHIDDHYDMSNIFDNDRELDKARFNNLHRYFEDLQGTSGNMPLYYQTADAGTRWHIRQLNLLCHEFESWALSYRKQIECPDWQRPSQLMCWLNAPRFSLDFEDLELFGIETLNRPLGGVFVGVNKAVGKHHWEVFCDEGRDSRVHELTTTTMRCQTEAAGDFDIEWGQNPASYPWQIKQMAEFRSWLVRNGFDPEDRSLTIGHPQVGQVDLDRTFGTKEFAKILSVLNAHLDVAAVRTSRYCREYPYRWNDSDFRQKQIDIISRGES